MYNVLRQHNAELHWFCKNCNTGTGKLLLTVSNLNTKVEKLEEEMVKMKAELHAEMAHSVPKVIMNDPAKMENRVERSEKKADEYKKEVYGSISIKHDDFENKLQDSKRYCVCSCVCSICVCLFIYV